MEFKYGDYVGYFSNGHIEIGRVVEQLDDNNYRVCYSSGCTSATTPASMLSPIINSRDIESTTLGFHRFDDSCPRYDPECCSYMCKEKSSV